MHRGYVKLWRCIEDTGLIGQPTAFYLYSYLLLKATHKAKSFVVGGAVFNLDAGQVLIGRNKLADETGLSVQQIRTALELLKKLSFITCKSTNKCTIVSIVNWDTYQQQQPEDNQQDGQQTNQQVNQHLTSAQPAPNQRLTTIQECKNINNNTPSNEGVVAAEPGDDEKPMKKSCPPCPHKQLVEAYHDTIPTLPKVKVWDKERERNMQARWRERWAAGKYATQQEGLAYWIRFFEYVKDSCPWLMGKVSDRNGKAFRADLGWMILPRNFKKIIEGRYEVQQQQDNSGDDLLAHIDAARREAREAAERHAHENSPWRRS